MAAAAGNHQPDERDMALGALESLSLMCEGFLVNNVPEFELSLGEAQKAVEGYRVALILDYKTERALAAAIARFVSQARVLIEYYNRHDHSSKASAADGLAFVEGFRSLQLKALEQTDRLHRFLHGIG